MLEFHLMPSQPLIVDMGKRSQKDFEWAIQQDIELGGMLLRTQMEGHRVNFIFLLFFIP